MDTHNMRRPEHAKGIWWKEAMLKEYRDLSRKVNRMERFLYKGLSTKMEGGQAERIDVVIQRFAMRLYLDALGRRCERHGLIAPAGRIQTPIYNRFRLSWH